MTSILLNDFSSNLVRCHKADIDNSSRNYYLFVGRTSPWTDENAPPTPKDTVKEFYETWNRIVAFKKITESNVSHVIRRYKWDTTGQTIYFPYDDDDELLNEHPTSTDSANASIGTYALPGTKNPSITSYTAGACYCVTSDLNVYKCISNRNSANLVVKSTVEPTGNSTSIIQTGDGYRWKYMYTVTASETEKFVVNDWIPVKTISTNDGSAQYIVQTAAVNGSIAHIRITSKGSGYTNTRTGTATAGTPSNITLEAGASATDNIYNGSIIYITGGTGVGQIRDILAYNGTSKLVTVSTTWGVTPNNTSQYSILPKITIAGSGSGAVAIPVVVGGEIVDVAMSNQGSGYTNATATIAGGGGSGCVLYPLISPPGGHGKNALTELNGCRILYNILLDAAESDFPPGNDYRTIGVMGDLLNDNGSIASASTRTAIRTLHLFGTVGSFTQDSTITSNGTGSPQGIVVDYSNNVLSYYQNETTGFLPIMAGESITSGLSGAQVSSVDEKEVLMYSGNLLYVENIQAISRNALLSTNIKIIHKL